MCGLAAPYVGSCVKLRCHAVINGGSRAVEVSFKNLGF